LWLLAPDDKKTSYATVPTDLCSITQIYHPLHPYSSIMLFMFLFADYSSRSNNFICVYLIVWSVFELSDKPRAVPINIFVSQREKTASFINTYFNSS
jgi:hypothetical protein